MIVVDSSVWIANLRGLRTPHVALLTDLAKRELLVVGDLVMAEVLQGARDEANAGRIERNLRRYVIEPIVDTEIAVKAAWNYRSLRSRGFTVRKTIDLLIGTFCIERGYSLLHDDRDFEPMENLLGLAVVR